MGHREGEKAALSVVGNGTSKEVSSNGGGFYMVVTVEAGDEAIKVSGVIVLNPKVIYY